MPVTNENLRDRSGGWGAGQHFLPKGTAHRDVMFGVLGALGIEQAFGPCAITAAELGVDIDSRHEGVFPLR